MVLIPSSDSNVGGFSGGGVGVGVGAGVGVGVGVGVAVGAGVSVGGAAANGSSAGGGGEGISGISVMAAVATTGSSSRMAAHEASEHDGRAINESIATAARVVERQRPVVPVLPVAVTRLALPRVQRRHISIGRRGEELQESADA